MIQAPFMYDFEHRPPFNEPAGRETMGWGPYYRCYQAADRWLFFAAPSLGAHALTLVPRLADLAGLPDDEVEIALTLRFRQLPAQEWARAFNASSAAAIHLGSLQSTRDEALQLESKGDIDISQATFRAIRHDRHPMKRWCDLVAPNAVRPQFSKITIPGPAPKYGSNTRTVLGRLGFAPEQIEAMIAAGDASEGWSEKYLPE